MSKKNYSKIPGPRGLPFIGSLLSLSRDKGKVLTSWANDYYGPVFKVKLGSRLIVTLQGYKAIQEALVKKADSFSGRLDASILTALHDNKGLFFTDMGNCWKFWHEFAVENLKTTWDRSLSVILNEAEDFKKYLACHLGSPINLEESLSISMMSTVLQICISKKYDVESPEAKELYNSVYETLREPYFSKLLFFPWLRCFPSYKRFMNATENLRIKKLDLIKNLVEERRENVDCLSIDLLSCFQQNEKRSDVETDEHLASFISDMIFAGSVTTASQLMWVLLLLLKNPICLKKIQQEFFSVLDGEKLTLDKINELHYTAAVIEEAYRMRPIAPTASLHKTNTPTSVSGYHIPEDTTVLVNLWSVHMDKSTWFPDPDTFRPERHLSQDGKFVKSGHVIPFSIGFRRCVGERIARTELVAYLASVLLSYDIKLAEESKDVDLNGVSESILKPKPFKVVLVSHKDFTKTN